MMRPPIPVFMYHHINPHKGDMVTVTPDTFERQMRYLTDDGYQTLSIDDLLAFIKGESPFSKGVVITFDDGYLDNYLYAYPILKRYGLRATIFIVTSWIRDMITKEGVIDIPTHRTGRQLIREGRPERVAISWDMVEEMKKSGLVDFYSHTHTHRKCSFSNGIDRDDLIDELKRSKEIIDTRIGRCDYLSWPRGIFDNDAIRMAKVIGYRGLFTTKRGVVGSNTDPLAIERIVVKDRVAWFRRRIKIYTNGLFSRLYLAILRR